MRRRDECCCSQHMHLAERPTLPGRRSPHPTRRFELRGGEILRSASSFHLRTATLRPLCLPKASSVSHTFDWPDSSASATPSVGLACSVFASAAYSCGRSPRRPRALHWQRHAWPSAPCLDMLRSCAIRILRATLSLDRCCRLLPQQLRLLRRRRWKRRMLRGFAALCCRFGSPCLSKCLAWALP